MENHNSVKFTNPEAAAQKGEPYYKDESVDEKTGDTICNVLPIFVHNPKKDGKYSVNPAHLYRFFELTEKYITVRNNSAEDIFRYIYRDGVFRLISEDDVVGVLKKSVEEIKISLLKIATLKEARELIDSGRPHVKHKDINRDEDIINFQNGLLHLPTMLLQSHSPKVLSTVQIPCNWTEKPPATPVFDDFMDTLTGNDGGIKQLLLEYMGAAVSNVYGYRFKKSLYLLGAGNTGKSRLSVLLEQLIGDDNTAWGDPKSLHERFGTTSLYLKRLLYANDLKAQKIEDMDIFKMITGGDPVPIENKFKNIFSYTFKGLTLYAMNQLPLFGGDKGKHVYDRIIIVRCDNVIPDDKRDPNLEAKLFAEREGIVHKCVHALRTAIKNNYKFSEPPVCEELRREYMRENSAVIEFWSECVEPRVPREHYKTTAETMYKAFCFWNDEQGNKFKPSSKEFRKEVCSWLGKPWEEVVKPIDGERIYVEHKLNEYGKKYSCNGGG